MVELRDPRPAVAIPELEVAADQALVDELVDEAEAVDVLERRRVGGRRARVVVDLAGGLDQGDAEAALRAGERRHHAGRAAARDHHMPIA